jgi:hypothetical protein
LDGIAEGLQQLFWTPVIDGLVACGAEVIDLGLCGTEKIISR